MAQQSELLAWVLSVYPTAIAITLAVVAAVFITHAQFPVVAKPGFNRVLVVIAHPDDEAMFFVPTIKALQAARWQVGLLCLTNGDGGGDGEVRTRELYKSAEVLGISAADVRVINDPRLKDSMEAIWSTDVVRDHVQGFLSDGSFHMVVTFDARGISGHANHTSVHMGVAILSYQDAHAHANAHAHVPFYELETVVIPRKFSSLLDLGLSLFCTVWRRFATSSPYAQPDAILVTQPDALLSDAVMRAHASQYVWFRKLFVLFSRHTFMNTLVRIRQN